MYYFLLKYGIQHHNDPEQAHDVVFYWNYDKEVTALHPVIENADSVINKGCYDISKKRTAQYFDNLTIDPQTYTGLAVRKKDIQCSKDDELIQCPCECDEGYICRRYIETRVDGVYHTYRLFYMNAIVMLAVVLNPGDFNNKSGERTIERRDIKIIPSAKRHDIVNGCKAMGVDYCEIDLLRDVNTGEWFVIDINNIAGGHGVWMTESGRKIFAEYYRKTHKWLQTWKRNIKL